MSLFELTKPMHHACEQHPVGQRMAKGDVTRQEWADWLWAFRTLHGVIDRILPYYFWREEQLTIDLAKLPYANPSAAALRFAADMVDENPIGACYVLHGAHRSGGRMMAPILTAKGLPCFHIQYVAQADVQDWIKATRPRTEFSTQAIYTFECLLEVMDEIKLRSRLQQVSSGPQSAGRPG